MYRGASSSIRLLWTCEFRRPEIRNPKQFRGPKSEVTSTPVESPSRSFGLRVSDLLRILAFGFRTFTQVSQAFPRELDATLVHGALLGASRSGQFASLM